MPSDALFLDAAAAIGRRIVAEAVWHDGCCSWMGAVARPLGSEAAEYHALGSSLYGGTAGVGLFLAHLANATGDGSFRRTAVGAIRHATAPARHSPLSWRDGFHAGSVGVAWAAARAALLLEEEELRARAVALSTRPDVAPGSDQCPDLITGIAGSALGLLALADQLGDPRLVARARAAGEILIRRATVTSHGWSWATLAGRYPAHLCGISHGAAGIGWALLDLFVATGDDRFRAGAVGAFAYERSWLDESAGRWPDLRIRGQRRGPLAPIDSGIAGTWCYGEAGIASTRLRAVAVLGPGPHVRDAEIAIETTRRHVEDALPYAIDDVSLCHGLGGAADVLLDAASASNVRCHHAADVATQLGHVMLERCVDAGRGWAFGAEGESTPGLFLGLSGIGWLFLRLHDPATPTPLAPI